MSSFCIAHICNKNINVFDNTLAITVNLSVINELGKLTKLLTTGPWYTILSRTLIIKHAVWINWTLMLLRRFSTIFLFLYLFDLLFNFKMRKHELTSQVLWAKLGNYGSLYGAVPLFFIHYKNILKILPSKNENFQIKNSDIFHISAQNIDCGYSLEPPRRGGSNEYPQSMLLSRNKGGGGLL